MNLAPSPSPSVAVGICVLNYHQPEATLACVRSLLEREGASTRILWIENDARFTGDQARAVLAGSGLPWQEVDPSSDPLPPAGTIAFIGNAENLGYAAGNNVGLRYLHGLGVPYAWILNNDTLLIEGSSAQLMAAAEARPEVGLWGATIQSELSKGYFGGRLLLKDFAIQYATELSHLEADPLGYVSGCSMFLRTDLADALGYIPEDYFLYYEDPAFSLEVHRQGLDLSAVPEVRVFHHESLSTGRTSLLKEFYCRRNRWPFIRRYFPGHFWRQVAREIYVLQRLLFRLKLRRVWLEWISIADALASRRGRTRRTFQA